MDEVFKTESNNFGAAARLDWSFSIEAIKASNASKAWFLLTMQEPSLDFWETSQQSAILNIVTNFYPLFVKYVMNIFHCTATQFTNCH